MNCIITHGRIGLAILQLLVLPEMLAHAQQALPTVPYVDLQSYSGTWYEIARLPNIFQRTCQCSTATYTLHADGSIQVVNRCITPRGRTRQVSGRAEAVPCSGNARLQVSFGRVSSLFAKNSGGNYWIIALGPAESHAACIDATISHLDSFALSHHPQYQWALVGTPDRKFLWILSRTPDLPSETYQQLVCQARELGFDVSRLIR
ncbi:MAG: lipocalin family protein [Pirellulaceae bacterium]|nr:lipocalin family protein [Pirellulaceae bacterium]